jgi:16S rRNA (guanine1207-N2)-methyltransferase
MPEGAGAALSPPVRPGDDPAAALRADLRVQTILREQTLQFDTTWGLFSPREVDAGTRLLLEHVRVEPNADCLDLGCGYGPIGLTLARLAPAGRTLLVDKDFVAVEYSRRNAELNQIANAEARLSNGFSHVRERQFDLIATNLPAKSGKELYYLFCYDALAHLRPGGALWVVSLSGLRRFVERALGEVFGNYTKEKQGQTYTVARATRQDPGT